MGITRGPVPRSLPSRRKPLPKSWRHLPAGGSPSELPLTPAGPLRPPPCKRANAGELEASLPTSLGASGTSQAARSAGSFEWALRAAVLRHEVNGQETHREASGPRETQPKPGAGTQEARSELSNAHDVPPSLGSGVPDVPTQRDASFLTERGAVSGTPAPCLLGTNSACPSPRPPGPLPLGPAPGRGR